MNGHWRQPELILGVVRRWLPYAEYRAQALDGDVALWEPTSLYGHLIATATDGAFSHSSGLVWLHDRLWSAGYEEHCNGHLSPLSAEVRRHSGRISVFRTVPPLDDHKRKHVARHLIGDLTGDYAWRNIRLLTLGQLVGLRWLTWMQPYRRWLREQSLRADATICSQHIARSFLRGAGVHFVHKFDAAVSPNDLARSPLLTYLGTLTWQEALDNDVGVSAA
ncbi:MAG: hypothetical protein ACK50P_17475 [Planctomycetaceae bacterium]|jgi:hypothetical protein